MKWLSDDKLDHLLDIAGTKYGVAAKTATKVILGISGHRQKDNRYYR